jgi:putative transposase
MSDSATLFKSRHFDSSIIILCVRWYITYKLCYHDLRDMMVERSIDLTNTTILRWVQHYVPEFDKKWNGFARPAGRLWRVDETNICVHGEWKYLYRAVDKQGNTVDFLLSEHRDIAAAERFFKKAIESHSTPGKFTLEGYAAMHTAVCELKESHILPISVLVWTSKYLSNLIEQDDRRIWTVPLILMNTSSMCHLSLGRGRLPRKSFAKVWPNFLHHWPTVSYVRTTPRSAISNSTSL